MVPQDILLYVCSQMFPISSKDNLADCSLPSDSTGVGGGSLITIPPRSKSHNSISEASWLFRLASADFACDDVTTHSSLSHNENAESVLIGRILALYFLLFYQLSDISLTTNGDYIQHEQNNHHYGTLSPKPHQPQIRPTTTTHTRVLTHLYTYIGSRTASRRNAHIDYSCFIIIASDGLPK